MQCFARSAGACTLAVLAALAPAATAQTYKSIGEYKVPGSSVESIALDESGRRLFVAGAEGVAVLNADTGASIGNIAGIKNAHDVLLVPEMKSEEKAPAARGYATDSGGHVFPFTLADLKASAPLKLETPGTSTLCYDAEARTLEAVSAGGSLTSIDPATNKIIKAGRIATGSGQIACGNMGHVYVADTAANVVHVLNHVTLKNDGDYPMKSGHRPSGLTLDTKGRRLFVACEDGTIEIIDTDSGFTFIELQGGKGAAHETFAWLPQGKGQWKAAAFVVQGDGTLSGIRMNAYINYTMAGQYKLSPGLREIAYDSTTHHLFITSMESGSPVVVVAGY